MTDGPLGELTGLPLSKFATAEMIARANAHGCLTLWDYLADLETRVAHSDLITAYDRHRCRCGHSAYVHVRIGSPATYPCRQVILIDPFRLSEKAEPDPCPCLDYFHEPLEGAE